VDEAKSREVASDPMLLATDVADYLVRRGVPFRRSHEIVGKLVAKCQSAGKALPNLSLEEFRAVDPAFDEAVFAVFDLETALAARVTTGAPSPDNVAAALERWKVALDKKLAGPLAP
jgi:argininosuccinate lyase